MMSTKATIFISEDDQHWHEEMCSLFNYGVQAPNDRCMVLEFGPDCKVDDFGDEGFAVIVPSGTPIFRILRSTRFSEDGQL